MAAATTCAAVNPNSRNRVAASADAPKWSIPMISPASPTMSRQPWGTPASTETRALTAAGRTFSRYPGVCSSNHSRHGIDTTRVAMPDFSSVSRASTASCTSEPVATRITSGVALLES